MKFTLQRFALLCLASTVVTATTEAEVLIVRPDGAHGFSNIQSAIDLSADGDTILVQTGSYPGFVVDDRTVSVVVDVEADVLIESTVTIQNLTQERTALLSGLRIRGAPLDAPNPVDGLRLIDNSGPTRVHKCDVEGGGGMIVDTGGSPPAPTLQGAPALRIVNCLDALITASVLRGGQGGLWPGGSFTGRSGDGGQGLYSSSSEVVVWDCVLEGGNCYNATEEGGDGGTGCAVFSGSLTASNCSFTGRRGGFGLDFAGGMGGAGGSALFTAAAATASLAQVEVEAGANGLGFYGYLPPVPVYAGQGLVTFIPELYRALEIPRLQVENAPLEITIRGKTGDSVQLLYGPATAASTRPDLPLPILVAKPGGLTPGPVGTITDLSGTATASFDLRDLPSETPIRQLWVQGLVTSADGRTHLSSPATVTIFNCSSLLPDCNSNGQFDSCDLLRGTSQDLLNDGIPDECELDCNSNGVPDAFDLFDGGSVDCQGNGVPDECEPDCNGDLVPDDCEPDCNGNGISDLCDLDAGPSVDSDRNGIPDECDGPIGIPIFVDDDAAAGGDGSAAAPFATIAEALQVVLPGNSIVVADGHYSGAGNRDLEFDDNVDLVSQNGPSACIVDCEGMSRFALINSSIDPSRPGRLRGFTIRNGMERSAQATALTLLCCDDFLVDDCVIEDCGSLDPGAGTGSPVRTCSSDNLTFINCRFERNEGRKGGAIHSLFDSGISIERCHFRENRGIEGGAIHWDTVEGSIRSSSFWQNVATYGGGVELLEPAVNISTSLFYENSASLEGGGIRSRPFSNITSALLVSHCAFFGNAAESGGGVHVLGTTDPSHEFNHCLIAGNSAESGAGIHAAGRVRVTHSTIVENIAVTRGGGVRGSFGGSLEVKNSILWGNSAPLDAQLDGSNASSLAVRYCDIQDFPLTLAQGCSEPWCGTNVDVDPLFIDADGPDNNPATLLGNDWRLSANSPLIDAGNNELAAVDVLDLDRDGNRAEPVPLDLNLRPRFLDLPNPDTGVGPGPLIDIGAFERQP